MTDCVLAVAMANSVHSLRWLRMVASDRYAVILLPSSHMPMLPEFASLPTVQSRNDLSLIAPGEIGVWSGTSPGNYRANVAARPLPIGWSGPEKLVHGDVVATAVCALRPLMVHSLEIQQASYACLEAARLIGPEFPPWLVSNWGSDLFLYQKLDAHRRVLREVLAAADALHCECGRDAVIAHWLGYDRAKPIYIMPASGGEDLGSLPLPQSRPSERDVILIKGYHGWAGRAMHVLSALLLAAPRLRGLRVRIVLGSEAVAAMGSAVAGVTGLDIQTDSWSLDRKPALERTASARMSIGVGISDGIGTSFLEAMALGAFPIAADTACADEWIRNGLDGLIVNPHDVEALARAILRAATDDALVDAAAPRNRREVEQRWNAGINRESAWRMYNQTMERADARPTR